MYMSIYVCVYIYMCNYVYMYDICWYYHDLFPASLLYNQVME